MAVERDPLRGLARASGLSRAELRRYLELEVIVLDDWPSRELLLKRLRRIRRLRRDLGLQLEAVAIIVRLLDRIEALEKSAPR